MSASLSEIPDQIRTLASDVAEESRRQLGETIRVIWFGSWVRGQAVPRSDLDLAVDAGAPIDPRAMADLRDAIEELATLHRIDVLNLNTASTRMRDTILSEGIAL